MLTTNYNDYNICASAFMIQSSINVALIALTNLLYTCRSIVRYTLKYRLQTPGRH